MAYKKVFEQKYPKGAIQDDFVEQVLIELNAISRHPEEGDTHLVGGDIGEESYYKIYSKNFKIVLYIED